MAAWNLKRSSSKGKAATSTHNGEAQAKEPAKAPGAIAPEMIAKRAFEIWEKLGRPAGQSEQHWLEAEAQLRREHRRDR